MSSPSFTRALTDEAGGENAVVLLTLQHAELAQLEIDRPDLGITGGAMRFTNADADLISRGDTFLAFPFAFQAPPQGERGRPTARLRIDNVDRRIAETIRLLSSAPTCILEIVFASDPDTVERTYPAFKMTSADWDAVSVSGSLSTRHDDDEPVSAWTHSPSFSPGLF